MLFQNRTTERKKERIKKKMTTLSPIILLLSFFLFPFTIHGKNATQILIQKTCETSAKTDPNIDYAFCTAALRAAPARQCATLRGIGRACIGLIMSNVTDTRRYIRGLLKGGRLQRRAKECVDDCYELYTDAVPEIGEAMENYGDMKYDDANVKISAVMDAAATCEDGFEESGYGGVWALAARNNATFQLSAMALSVMHQIQGGTED